MIRIVLIILATSLAVPSTISAKDDLCRATGNCDYEIREKLLSIPVWTWEMTRAARTHITGEVRFKMQGQKLIADVDVGWKCQAEVKFVEGGFMVGCDDPKKYVQVAETYQSVWGSYILTFRPPR